MLQTICMRVYGIVQGVGFRPAVSRHALAAGVTGTVCNKGPYVEIIAQGEGEALARLEQKIEQEPPERAVILRIEKRAAEPGRVYDEFSIVESEAEAGEILIPPDIAICPECERELYDKKNRRYLHPFINCTCCGPRLTILDALPYDRERTSMGGFAMCPECRREYGDPESRRYDAQPVCCNDCGPEVYLLGENVRGMAAITKARQILCDGGIIAVKGIGGFHLCCDAANEGAVKRLRKQKNRPTKPFAVMMKDIDTVKRECLVTPEQEKVLTGHQKPIALLEKRAETALCTAVAPLNPKAGVMLPYAPVQRLLFDCGDGLPVSDMLVMTSGNESGAPICREEAEAAEELGGLCDAILSHNRAIRMRADDTVMDFYRSKEYMIRRSRGYAPLPYFVEGEENSACILALGGELKNAFCIGKNRLFYLSPYIGDMEDMRTAEALRESVGRFCGMLEAAPEAVACDLHPRYCTTAMAEEYRLPILRIQHHHAHIVSCMAENGYMEPVLGVAFDGTGYGTDGTIWGGEFLLADACSFTRFSHIDPFLQIGGDLSAKEGWRIAASMIFAQSASRAEALDILRRLSICTEEAAAVLGRMYDARLNAVTSTSAGRLFDAVSAILGTARCSTYEGEASVRLQFVAQAYRKTEKSTDFPKAVQEVQSTDALVRFIIKEKLEGADSGFLAWAFHVGLAAVVTDACKKMRGQTGRNVVALSGGCFQNLLFLELCENGLQEAGFRVLIHHLVPPNDGGIALGQAVAARNCLMREKYGRNQAEEGTNRT